MSIAHFIIIIKSEVSTFPIVIIFFRGCVPQNACYIIFCHLLHIHFVSIIAAQFMMSVHNRVRYGLQAVSVGLYITPTPGRHQCANLSEDIEPIECLSDTFCRVCE